MASDEPFGKEKYDEFLILLGTCITEWAWIEDETFKLCHAILGTIAQHSSIIFYRTPTLEARLVLANDLVGTLFPKPESGKHPHKDGGLWAELVKDIRSEMSTRNQLAHSPVGAAIFGFTDEITTEVAAVREIRMLSYLHEQKTITTRFADTQPLEKSDLDKHLMAVRSLHMRFRTFRIGIAPHIVKISPQNGPI